MSVKSGERKVRLTVQVTTSKNAAEIFFGGGRCEGGELRELINIKFHIYALKQATSLDCCITGKTQ